MSTQSQPIIPVTMPYDSYNRNNGNNEFQHLTASIDRNAYHTQHQASVAEARQQASLSEGRQQATVTETRQNNNRNTDQLSTQFNANSIAEILAIQNTSTATQLGIQNTATATQLGIQNTATATQFGIKDAAASNAALLSAISVQAERINGLNVVESKNIQVNQGRDLGAIQLQAAQNFSTLQLQASESKALLQNHITYTSDQGILKTVEKINSVMDKLNECCCENKMLHSDTRNMIVANELATLRASMPVPRS